MEGLLCRMLSATTRLYNYGVSGRPDTIIIFRAGNSNFRKN